MNHEHAHGRDRTQHEVENLGMSERGYKQFLQSVLKEDQKKGERWSHGWEIQNQGVESKLHSQVIHTRNAGGDSLSVHCQRDGEIEIILRLQKDRANMGHNGSFRSRHLMAAFVGENGCLHNLHALEAEASSPEDTRIQMTREAFRTLMREGRRRDSRIVLHTPDAAPLWPRTRPGEFAASFSLRRVDHSMQCMAENLESADPMDTDRNSGSRMN